MPSGCGVRPTCRSCAGRSPSVVGSACTITVPRTRVGVVHRATVGRAARCRWRARRRRTARSRCPGRRCASSSPGTAVGVAIEHGEAQRARVHAAAAHRCTRSFQPEDRRRRANNVRVAPSRDVHDVAARSRRRRRRRAPRCRRRRAASGRRSSIVAVGARAVHAAAEHVAKNSSAPSVSIVGPSTSP